MAVETGQNENACNNVCEKCGRQKREVMNLVNCVKVILYTYSKLSEIERDYESHIRLKALTSYDYRRSTEKIAEYIATQVVLKGLFRQLRECAERALNGLTEEENLLLGLRYFGKMEQLKKGVRRICTAYSGKERKEKILSFLALKKVWSERTYFRKQKVLLEKICRKFESIGMTREKFEEEYGEIELFNGVKRFLESEKENALTGKEIEFVKELRELTKEE